MPAPSLYQDIQAAMAVEITTRTATVTGQLIVDYCVNVRCEHCLHSKGGYGTKMVVFPMLG